MPTLAQCPRCQATITPQQAVCPVCGLVLDPAGLAAFQAEQARLGISSVQTAPPPAGTTTSGWGCLGAIFDFIGGIFNLFD